MRKIASSLLVLTAFSISALAGNFSGKLIDSACYDQHKKAAGCSVTGSTSSFAIDVSGKVYKLDSAGNTKAAAAMKNRADRTDPSKSQTASPSVMATVTGDESAGTITVESIDVQ